MSVMNRRTPALLGALLLASCVPINGSNDAAPDGCPAIACGPSYQIDFARAAWTAGTYTIEVNADGAQGSCEIMIPLSCDRGPRCMGSVGWLPSLIGCALDPGQQSIKGITFDRTTPARVEVRVEQGERTLGVQTFSPAYSTSSTRCLTCTQAPTDQLPLQ
jgi:hypothetical protein